MPVLAQDDDINYTWQTFRDTRVINGHSVESGQQGEMKFIISHRFAEVSRGSYELFGLDISTIRMGLDYAITNNLDVGIGRSSFQKTYDGYVKFKFLSQSSGAKVTPVSMSFLQGLSINGLRRESGLDLVFTDRIAHVSQLILARKLSPTFSLQASPTYLHKNLIESSRFSNDLFYLGIASKIQFSKVTSVLVEYFPRLFGDVQSNRTNSLSIGMEIQTKAHVFQFSFSNSFGMVENLFLTETIQDWADGGFGFGFNITRDFKIGKRKFQ